MKNLDDPKQSIKKRFSRLQKKVITFLPGFFYENSRKRLSKQPLSPIDFSPSDHFPHKPFGIEWWYFTGVMNTPARNSPLGFEVTFFRIRTIGEGRILHTAITDVEKGVFRNKSLSVALYPGWLDHPDSRHVISIFGNYLFFDVPQKKFIINTKMGDLAASLQMDAGDMMSHGREGIIDNVYLNGSSYYYSFPNLKTTGVLSYRGNTFNVSGMTWHDHQWGNFAICDIAWEWFSLRFDEKKLYIMVFVFKRRNSVIRTGNIMCQTGSTGITDISIKSKDVFITKNKLQYPVCWELCIGIGGRTITFNITPMLKEQCINSLITPSYWEGLCCVEGEVVSDIKFCDTGFRAGTKLKGYAYVEITGYE